MSWNPENFDFGNGLSTMSAPGMAPIAAATNWAPYLTMTGGGLQAGASLASGFANAKNMRLSAGLAGLQAQSAEQAGGEQAQLYRQHLEQTIGKQSAQIGGANVTASGSALRSLSTTAELGARDIAQIQLNAQRKAWGFRVNQANDLQQAGYAKQSGIMGAFGSLITSGTRAYGQWSSD
jgi:hypothetical protein